MTEAMVNASFQDREARDQRAIEWTVASLTDDSELLPFIEAIPDAVVGPIGFRYVNDEIFLLARERRSSSVHWPPHRQSLSPV